MGGITNPTTQTTHWCIHLSPLSTPKNRYWCWWRITTTVGRSSTDFGAAFNRIIVSIIPRMQSETPSIKAFMYHGDRCHILNGAFTSTKDLIPWYMRTHTGFSCRAVTYWCFSRDWRKDTATIMAASELYTKVTGVYINIFVSSVLISLWK